MTNEEFTKDLISAFKSLEQSLGAMQRDDKVRAMLPKTGHRYSIEILSNGYTRVFDRESLLSSLYYTNTGLYYTGDLPQANINQFTGDNQIMQTLTTNDAGCYVDGARGIYAIDAIANAARSFGLPEKIIDISTQDSQASTLSEYEFANDVEDDIDTWLNENTEHEGMFWGRNDNGDWGLWMLEDSDN